MLTLVPVFFDTRVDFYGESSASLRRGHAAGAAALDCSRPLSEALAMHVRFETLVRDGKSVVVRRLH